MFKIVHLYPDKMNLYGDMGNILALKKILTDCLIPFEYIPLELGDSWDGKADILFMGGGQDSDQESIYGDFLSKKDLLLNYLDNNGTMLAICGAYQLLGQSFVTANQTKLKGLGFLPINTIANQGGVKTRCIGNVAIKANPIISTYLNKNCLELGFEQVYKEIFLVGFENHGGQTKIIAGSKVDYLGEVLYGHGNAYQSGNEGVMFKNVIATYLHGSCLPKNPELTKYLILKALDNKNN